MTDTSTTARSLPVFEDPPPIRHPGYEGSAPWMPILEALVEYPEKWAVIREFTNLRGAEDAAGNLRRRRTKMPEGRWQFTTRTTKPDEANPKGTSKLYARYLGPDEEDLPDIRDDKTHVSDPVAESQPDQPVPFHDEPKLAPPEVEYPPEPEPPVLEEPEPMPAFSMPGYEPPALTEEDLPF